MEHLYSIMRLDLDRVDEICADIQQQYEQSVATCALFYCKLVPEGKPLINKAEIFGEVGVSRGQAELLVDGLGEFIKLPFADDYTVLFELVSDILFKSENVL